MTRAEKIAEAQRLRAQGLTYREIGERMGFALQTVGEWITDTDRSKKKARLARYSQPCVDCGAPTDGSRGYAYSPERCRHCDARIVPERMREVWAPYRQMIEEMWTEGMTMREINEAVGHEINFSSLRARGYNLPHRHAVGDLTKRLASLERARAARA